MRRLILRREFDGHIQLSHSLACRLSLLHAELGVCLIGDLFANQVEIIHIVGALQRIKKLGVHFKTELILVLSQQSGCLKDVGTSEQALRIVVSLLRLVDNFHVLGLGDLGQVERVTILLFDPLGGKLEILKTLCNLRIVDNFLSHRPPHLQIDVASHPLRFNFHGETTEFLAVDVERRQQFRRNRLLIACHLLVDLFHDLLTL